MAEISSRTQTADTTRVAILAALNIADELFRAVNTARPSFIRVDADEIRDLQRWLGRLWRGIRFGDITASLGPGLVVVVVDHEVPGQTDAVAVDSQQPGADRAD